jgi:hypothetical protein
MSRGFEEVYNLAVKMMRRMEEEAKRMKLTPGGLQYDALKYGAAAIGGGLAGYQIGESTGSTAGGFYGGAAAGALAGSAFGPWGAAIGGLAGAAGGLLGASKAQQQAAEELHTAAQQFLTTKDAYVTGSYGNSIADQLKAEMARVNDLGRASADLYKKGAISANENAQNFLDISAAYQRNTARIASTFWEGIAHDLNALNGPAGEYQNQLNAIEKSYRDNKAAAEALNATSEQLQQIEELRVGSEKKLADAMARTNQRDYEDLSAEYLRAQGYGQRADDLEFQNAQRRRYEDAVTAGKSPEFLELLTRTQMAQAEQRAHNQEVERQTKAIQDALAAQLTALDAQIKTAQDQLKVAEDQLRAQEQAVQATQRAFDAITQFAAGLSLNTSLTTLSPIQQLAEARRQYADQLALAQGGDRNAAAGISSIAQTYLTDSRNVNASGTNYVADFFKVQKDLAALASTYGGALTYEQQTLKELQAQTLALQTQIAIAAQARDAAQQDAQRQIDAINAGSLAVRKSLDRLPGATDPFTTGAATESSTIKIADAAVGTNNRLDAANDHLSAIATVNQEGHLGTISMLGSVDDRLDTLINAMSSLSDAIHLLR